MFWLNLFLCGALLAGGQEILDENHAEAIVPYFGARLLFYGLSK